VAGDRPWGRGAGDRRGPKRRRIRTWPSNVRQRGRKRPNPVGNHTAGHISSYASQAGEKWDGPPRYPRRAVGFGSARVRSIHEGAVGDLPRRAVGKGGCHRSSRSSGRQTVRTSGDRRSRPWPDPQRTSRSNGLPETDDLRLPGLAGDGERVAVPRRTTPRLEIDAEADGTVQVPRPVQASCRPHDQSALADLRTRASRGGRSEVPRSGGLRGPSRRGPVIRRGSCLVHVPAPLPTPQWFPHKRHYVNQR
jgi:hypothetical protein